MIEKEILFGTISSFWGHDLEKRAAAEKENISPEIKKYIKGISSHPEHIYVLASPMGASEYYGANNNSDFFSEASLNPDPSTNEYGYKTFEKAHIFRSHVNKDPGLSMGRVVKSAYNTDMHRIEVIMEFDKDKASDVIDKIEQAEEKRASGEDSNNDLSVGISMGCRLVDGDECSICGNKARSRADYCEHLSTQMGEVLSDGRKVMALNPKPIFFDLSIVESPAAKESALFKKVAHKIDKSKEELVPAEIRMSYSDKDPEIIKKAKNVFNRLFKIEPEIPKEILNKIAEQEYTDIINTANTLGIIFKPKEFQYITLKKGEKEKLAEQYYDENIIFPRTTALKPFGSCIKNEVIYDEKVANEIKPFLAMRSGFDPNLSMRMLNIDKKAERVNKEKTLQNPLLEEVSRLYNGYREYLLQDISQEKIASMLVRYSELIGCFLSTDYPEIKMASFEEFSTPDKIAKGMLSKISRMYLLLI